MKFFFFLFHTLAFTLIVVQGKIREANALVQKPKVLQATPSAGVTTSWASSNGAENMTVRDPNRKLIRHVRLQPQYIFRQREQSKRSVELNMADGNAGLQMFQRRSLSSPPVRSFLLLSVIAATALWKAKAVMVLLQYPGWFLLNFMYKPYQNSLVKNPLVTKVITGAVLAITGDAVAQATSNEAGISDPETKTSYDKRRALSFAVFDSCYRVFQHNMFPAVIRLGQGNFIKSVLPKILPWEKLVAFLTPAAAAIEQTTIYQFVIVPFLYYPIFFAFTGFIQGLSVSQSIERMKRQFFPCWKRNLMFWIPTQMVLFGVVAEKWQIPFACLMGMIWSMILSKTAGNTKKR